ncbi:hypothetical protein LR48_Vigan549s007400 [Vigna angularis]|uniref:CRM domain-containing protein n=1 Tax=Phaseolus angularis TaxID=3914 RepID=A0A0L9TEF3_PHAAN|nr:hypothetical protein LR48_Vigan549s007400 [Vigna angularis]
MLFLSLRPRFSPNSDSYFQIHISSSLLPPSNNSHNHQPPSQVPIKAPTPPWMKGPLLLQPNELVDMSKPKSKKFKWERQELSDKDLMGKEARGKRAMKKIVKKVEKLRSSHNSAEALIGSPNAESLGGVLGSLKENEEVRRTKGRMPWENDAKFVYEKIKRKKAATSAELTLDKVLLQRLRNEAASMRTWVKVKKAGVTQDVVDQIKSTWRRRELAMVKFDIPLCKNMSRAREIVEVLTKTGGLVVLSKKDFVVVYRGCNHQLTTKGYPNLRKNHSEMSGAESVTNGDICSVDSNRSLSEMLNFNAEDKDSVSTSVQKMNFEAANGSLYERETDRLLDDLGPRFIDWWRPKPFPVDADLLPEDVPGFQTPLRLCPPHSGAKLSDYELTYFRKLAHPLPTHFVLGRNKGLKGLAAAILKLWEKSLIAKIAIKYGIPNTDNEMMANELKRLTEGVLLLRNKFYIILYRGNDFLPKRVAALVENRELELNSYQFHEEVARMKALEAFSPIDEVQQDTSTSGTLTEFKKIQTKFEDTKNRNKELNIQLEAEICRLEKELKEKQYKSLVLNKKIAKSGKELSKLNAAWTPSEQDNDLEIMTDEERECFRKIGLKMQSCLLLGRRGIFDGVLEGLHQHWKHREVVKVITMQKLFSQSFKFFARQKEQTISELEMKLADLHQRKEIVMRESEN